MSELHHGPIVVFLGAGASEPLGKMVMSGFISHLSKIPEVGNDLLFRAITERQPDLEFLLEELQSLEHKSYLDKYLSAHGSSANFRARGALQLGPNSGVDIPLHAAALRQRITTRVYYSYRDFEPDAQTRLKDHFAPLFDAVARRLPTTQPIAAFTTNYDPGIEEFCYQSADSFALKDGFVLDPQSGWSRWVGREQATWSSSAEDRRAVLLFKLHGSTNWFRNRGEIVKGPAVHAGNDPQYSNVIIYPAQRKIADAEPFFTAYYHLGEMLAAASALLSVGYSFRDLDALTRLMSAQRKNPSLAVGIVSPEADQIEAELKRHGVSNCFPISGCYDIRDAQFKITMASIENWLDGIASVPARPHTSLPRTAASPSVP